jgi:hypothetical protein
VILVVTIISIVAVAAHCPASGVNVYVEVLTAEVLIVSGFQVPEIPLFEVAGRTGATLFWQRGPIKVKVGAMLVVIKISIVTLEAHRPRFGVKV